MERRPHTTASLLVKLQLVNVDVLVPETAPPFRTATLFEKRAKFAVTFPPVLIAPPS